MKTQRVFSGAPWEKSVGYCRAIKSGNFIAVSGTTSVDSAGQVWGRGDGYLQAKRCLEIIQRALNEVGADLKDVIRTRMFVSDISLWEQYGRAHSEFFGNFPPATSMYEVKALINPEMLIEIEVDAIVAE
ncbi:MAG: RidA family protein [Bdellovibrionia bacterium]